MIIKHLIQAWYMASTWQRAAFHPSRLRPAHLVAQPPCTCPHPTAPPPVSDSAFRPLILHVTCGAFSHYVLLLPVKRWVLRGQKRGLMLPITTLCSDSSETTMLLSTTITIAHIYWMLTMYPALVGHSHLLPHLTFLITPELVLLYPCFTAKQLEPQEGCVIGQGHTAHGITFVSEGTFTRGKHEEKGVLTVFT